MITSSFDDNGLQFAWNSTSIKLAEECLYKYHLIMKEGWATEVTSVHLAFGGWYAAALENYHKLIAEGMTVDDATIEVVRQTLVASWVYPRDEDGNEILEGGEPWDGGHNLKTRDNLIRTIVWYLDHFRDDAATTVILDNGKAAVEYTFVLPVDNDLFFTGHLDRLVEYAGKPYVQDQKTTGTTISQRYFEGYSPDTQMSMYTFAGKAIWNVPVHGVMIDAAQIAVGFTRFERGFTFRAEAQLNEWYDHTMYHIEAARNAVKNNYFPMNRTACGNYGGCPFRHACSRSPEVRQQFLKSSFVRKPIFDPLTIR